MGRYRKCAAVAAAAAALALLALCGQSPTSSGSHISEGKKYLEAQDYYSAEAEFQKAIDADSLNADALYLHAKAVLLQSGLSLLDCMDFVTKVQEVQTDPLGLMNLVDSSSWDETDRLYKVNITVTRDLKPIFNGRTHGFYDKHDIVLDYLIASTVKSVLGLLDIFPPLGEIDNPASGMPDLGISFENGQVSFDTTALESLIVAVSSDPDQFNATIDQLVNNLGESQNIIAALGGEELDVEVDDAAMDSSVTDMKNMLIQYRCTPGIDDDGDGLFDEETLDGLDNDADGRVDEDFHL